MRMAASKKPRDVLARNVRRLRTARDLSQEKLAADADLRQALISEIEIGVANPTLDSLTKIAAALKVEMIDLFASK